MIEIAQSAAIVLLVLALWTVINVMRHQNRFDALTLERLARLEDRSDETGGEG